MDKEALRQASAALAGKLSQPEEFVAGLHRLLEAHADEKAFTNYRRIIPEMGTTFGTPLPVLRVIAAEIARQGKKEPHSVLPLLETLWDNGSFEERQIVGKVMERMAKKYPAECLILVPGFLPTLDNWANCDNLACLGMKAIALQMADEVLSLCEQWVQDENKWIRRFGVVALRAFSKDGPSRAGLGDSRPGDDRARWRREKGRGLDAAGFEQASRGPHIRVSSGLGSVLPKPGHGVDDQERDEKTAAMIGNRAFRRLRLSQFAWLVALHGLNFAAVMQMEQATHSSARMSLVAEVNS